MTEEEYLILGIVLMSLAVLMWYLNKKYFKL